MIQYHNRCRLCAMLAATPALAYIRTPRLFAHRCQFQFAQLRLNFVEIRPNRNLFLQPWRQTQSFLVPLFPFQFAVVALPFVLCWCRFLHKVLKAGTRCQSLTNLFECFGRSITASAAATGVLLFAEQKLAYIHISQTEGISRFASYLS